MKCRAHRAWVLLVLGCGRANLFALAGCAKLVASPVAPVTPVDQAPSAFVIYVGVEPDIASLVLPIAAGLATHRPDEIALLVVPGLLAEVAATPVVGGSDTLVVATNTGELTAESPSDLEALWAFRCRGASEQLNACTVTANAVVTIETRFSTIDHAKIAEVAQQGLWIDKYAIGFEPPCACIHLPYLDREVFVERGLDHRRDSFDWWTAEDALLDDAAEDDGGDDEGDDDECEDPCDDGGCTVERLASVFGGTVQTIKEHENINCGNRYITASVGGRAFSVDSPDLSTWANGVAFVEAFRIDGDGVEVPWPIPIDSLPTSIGDEEDASEVDTDAAEDGDTDDYGIPCTPMDGDIYSVHRGMLVRSIVGLDQIVSCAWHEVAAATPTTCPTSADPCGDHALFPSLATTDAQTDFWVASDGSAALVWSTPPHLLGRASWGADDPIAVALTFPEGGAVEANVMRAAVLGVHYYADGGPIHAAIAASLPQDEWAFGWLPWPVALGSRDPEGGPVSLPASVARVVDHGDGKGWGNHCFRQYKAGHTTEAFEACEYALTLATSPDTRAAVFHSLGLIASRERNWHAAVAYFRTSLEFRDHEATLTALKAAFAKIEE